MSLQNKTALVTAAAQGIGRASAEALARAGVRVIATDLNEVKLEELRGLPGVTIRKLDVLDEKSVATLVGDVGAIDILFNCAGIVPAGTILDCTEEDWGRTFDLNVTAMYRMAKEIGRAHV